MTRADLPHLLERDIVIQASREIVFGYFTDSAQWARWWGQGSSIEPRAGRAVLIVHPGGVQVTGEILEIDPPVRLAFTYGYVSGAPIPIGGSLVTVRLDDDRQGTRLRLTHAFADAAARDLMVQGWRYQLAVFANLVADDVHAGAAATIDDWLAAWSEPDTAKRDATLDRIASERVRFKDRFSLVDGMADLRPHLAAVHRFMPGLRLEREGRVRHCQGTVLADWVARGSDGREHGRGTSVFAVNHHGRIEAVTGFWDPPKASA